MYLDLKKALICLIITWIMTGKGQILHCTAWSWEFARNLSSVLKTNKNVINET